MMMNRKRLGRVMAVVAVVLAFFFVGSSVFLGLGTNVSYNLFDLFGPQNQPQQANQGPDPQQQIAEEERRLRENPNDPDNIKDLAGLYYQNGRYDDAIRVLEDGRKAAPDDAEIPILLGQVYLQQAPSLPQKEQDGAYRKAGDAFAAATEVDPENEEAYLQAGQAYEQAGEPAEAIKYYNGYLELEPNGEYAEQTKDRISALLEGGESTGSAQP